MLCKQIESLRRKKGLSQAELAQLLHISTSAVGMYEQGRREPPVSILIAMAKEFNVTLDYLITGKVYVPMKSTLCERSERVTEALSALKELSYHERMILLATVLLEQ